MMCAMLFLVWVTNVQAGNDVLSYVKHKRHDVSLKELKTLTASLHELRAQVEEVQKTSRRTHRLLKRLVDDGVVGHGGRIAGGDQGKPNLIEQANKITERF